jgi:hypothetical protein
MTSRRDFLKLAAVAPIAAPVLAKSAASQPFYSGGYIGKIDFGLVGEKTGESLFTPSQMRALQSSPFPVDRLVLSPPDLNELYPPWEIPNRLFGARVNRDGDAI